MPPSDSTTAAVPAPPVQRLAWVSYLLLIALTVAWETGLAAKGPAGFWLTVKVLPLLVPLSGLSRGRLRAHVIASLITLLYLTEGLVLLWTERAAGFGLSSPRPWALLEVLLALGFIVSASYTVRTRRARGESLT